MTVALFEPRPSPRSRLPAARRRTRPECLALEATLEGHAIVLSGGSGFGLDAATGARRPGCANRGAASPSAEQSSLAPQSDLFRPDEWRRQGLGPFPPYRDLAYEACGAAAKTFRSDGRRGYGATTADLKGGLGSASVVTSAGHIGALVIVNAIGSAVAGGGPHFWASPWEIGKRIRRAGTGKILRPALAPGRGRPVTPRRRSVSWPPTPGLQRRKPNA